MGGAFHMYFFLRRDLTAIEIAAVHTFFSMWNPLNDIFSGFLADEWVARGFGTRLSLVVLAHIGYAASTLFAFQDTIPLPMWVQYSLAIFASDGFAAIAGTVNGLLLIEQTVDDRQRIQIQRLNSVFGCFEWSIMATAYWLWDASPVKCGAFRLFLTAACIGSVMATLLAARGLRHASLVSAPSS